MCIYLHMYICTHNIPIYTNIFITEYENTELSDSVLAEGLRK